MITPEEIRVKARNLYLKALQAWIEGDESFFPRPIPANLDPGKEISAAIRQIEELREGSKERRGYGYSVTWETRKSRAFGENAFPTRITIDTREDLLRLIGKLVEFEKFAIYVRKLNSAALGLDRWLRGNWRKLVGVDLELDSLLTVVRYLQVNPRPDCFPRELPLPISTKLVEVNQKLLGEWLEVALPHTAIDYSVPIDDFPRRYGFRSAEPHFLLRILDERLHEELGVPFGELSLPLSALSQLRLSNVRIVICENKVNLLTLPQLDRTVALGGLGNGIHRLFDISWLATNELFYWGDIDIEGLTILARIRHRFPQTKSVMMGIQTLEKYANLITQGNAGEADAPVPMPLVIDEAEAYHRCRSSQQRLEQEHIPQSDVNVWFESHFRTTQFVMREEANAPIDRV